MKLRGLVIRLVALVGLVAVLTIAFSETGNVFNGLIDLKAALLVFVAPVLLLMIFQRETISWSYIAGRIRQLRQHDDQKLYEDLIRATEAAAGSYGLSSLVTLTQSHPDPFLQYGGNLVASRFENGELAELLAKKLDSEDSQWQSAYNLFGFLAKMAPYFGMLATVIGMVKLLEHMNDFTRISGAMAMAMQGTLYGLVSFTIVYSPLQKMFMGYRDMVFKRNERIAQWLLAVAQKSDPVYVRETLRSQRFEVAEWRSNPDRSRVATAPGPDSL